MYKQNGITMELDSGIKGCVDVIKQINAKGYVNISFHTIKLLYQLQDLCDGAGETKWTIKDQINLAIEELKY